MCPSLVYGSGSNVPKDRKRLELFPLALSLQGARAKNNKKGNGVRVRGKQRGRGGAKGESEGEIK